MPYAIGEIPEVGDYVKNQWGQLGTVTRVRFAPNEEERICIRRDDEVGSARLKSTMHATPIKPLARSISGLGSGTGPVVKV